MNIADGGETKSKRRKAQNVRVIRFSYDKQISKVGPDTAHGHASDKSLIR